MLHFIHPIVPTLGFFRGFPVFLQVKGQGFDVSIEAQGAHGPDQIIARNRLALFLLASITCSMKTKGMKLTRKEGRKKKCDIQTRW